MPTHLGQTVLLYPGSNPQHVSPGIRPIPGMVVKVHGQHCVDIELLTGHTHGWRYTSVTHEEQPTGHGHVCWHELGSHES